jgi:hypothetical protein
LYNPHWVYGLSFSIFIPAVTENKSYYDDQIMEKYNEYNYYLLNSAGILIRREQATWQNPSAEEQDQVVGTDFPYDTGAKDINGNIKWTRKLNTWRIGLNYEGHGFDSYPIDPKTIK